MNELTVNLEAKSGPAPETALYVSSDFLDFHRANRQLMTVTAKGEVIFADDLTIDEAKYIIREILKWKMNL